MAVHKVTRKGECRLGRVQVEDWTEVYPDILFYTVALYTELDAQPKCKWLKYDGKRRLAYDYKTEAEANAAYDFLMDGGDPHELSAAFDKGLYWTDWDVEHCIPH